MSKEMIEFFQDSPIRKVEINNEWWVSIVDVAKAIGYTNPQRHANQTITRNIERFQGYSQTLKLSTIEKTRNGGKRNNTRSLTVLNLKGVIAFCMLSDLPNAIPFQRWADKILADHIEKRVKAKYGSLTEKTITARKMETAEWKRHGAETKDYRDLTLLEYELLGFEEDQRKGNMSPDEILKLTISNLANTYQLKQIENKIYKQGIEVVMNKTNIFLNGLDNKEIENDIKSN